MLPERPALPAGDETGQGKKGEDAMEIATSCIGTCAPGQKVWTRPWTRGSRMPGGRNSRKAGDSPWAHCLDTPQKGSYDLGLPLSAPGRRVVRLKSADRRSPYNGFLDGAGFQHVYVHGQYEAGRGKQPLAHH